LFSCRAVAAPNSTQPLRRSEEERKGVQGDVSKADDLDRLFAAVKADKGQIDVLFANAGLGNLAPLGAITPEQFDKSSTSTSRARCSPCRRRCRC
jgi:NAD(P)-dependent dehydrogenase (short-subunit alcohol dehydrogenase family)